MHWVVCTALLAVSVLVGIPTATAYESPSVYTGGVGTNGGSTFTQTWAATGSATSVEPASTMGSRGYTATDFTPSFPTTQPSATGRVTGAGCTATTGICGDRGTLTVTFEHPVMNPRLHFSGLGGSTRFPGTSPVRQSDFHAIFTLATPGVTLSKLSGGNLAVNGGTTITAIDDDTGPSCTTTVNPQGTPNFRATAGCGSVQVNTSTPVTSLTFNTSLSVVANPFVGAPATLAELATGIDEFVMTATTPQDYSDAPTSYNLQRLQRAAPRAQ